MLDELDQMMEISRALNLALDAGDVDRVVSLLRKRQELTEHMGHPDPKDPDVTSGKVAEKLREKVASVVHFDKEVITVSIGVSSFTTQDTLETWFDRTDKALYHAKQEGRNRVCLSEKTELSNRDLIDWHREWDTGHKGIDQQHRELLKIANSLIKAMINNESQNTAVLQLRNLLGHIDKHFKYEEQVLSEIQYDDYAAHAESHRQLLVKAQEIFERSTSGNFLLSDVVKFVVGDVITLHLLEEDQKFFEALNKGRQHD